METKSIRVDFYRVEMPKGTRPLEEIIEDARAKRGAHRNVKVGDHWARLCKGGGESGHGIREGDLIRIRMNQLPLKAGLDGKTEPIELGDDEGIGEETAFLYHSGTRVLALQRNRSGITPYSFARYFGVMGGLDEPICLDPIVAKDAMERVKSMSEIRRFELRLAANGNDRHLKSAGVSNNQLLELQEFFDAPTLLVQASTGKTRRSLSIKAVLSAVKHAFKIHDSHERELERVRVSGLVDSEREVVDLLIDRVVYHGDVPLDRKRRLQYDDRAKLLRTAWQDVHKRFGSGYAVVR